MSYNMRTKRVKARPPHTPLIECCSPATCRSQIGDVGGWLPMFCSTLPSDGGWWTLGWAGILISVSGVRTPETTIATRPSHLGGQHPGPRTWSADSDTTSSDRWPPGHWLLATLGIFPAQKQCQNISDQIISYLQKVPRTVVGYIYTFKGSIDVKQIDGENTNIVLHLLCQIY